MMMEANYIDGVGIFIEAAKRCENHAKRCENGAKRTENEPKTAENELKTPNIVWIHIFGDVVTTIRSF